MNVFHCDHCDHLAFFENTLCVNCQYQLAFLPDIMQMGSLEAVGPERWSSPTPGAQAHSYRLCRNYRDADICNWAIVDGDANPLCESCRLTRRIPDLSAPGAKHAWYRLEAAKRRVIYALKRLGLPIQSTSNDSSEALIFEFLADTSPSGPPVLTGHSQGIITINIAEADDAERERRRHTLGEPYRTLLGHLRHEVGHYYWGRLMQDPMLLTHSRELFGDEREDYAASLERHYQDGPKADWQTHFVSAYASAHPWEDWAETWAHYLHMADVLEMASACGVSVRPRHAGDPVLVSAPASAGTTQSRFERLIATWHPLTYVLNNLNRSMGLADAYPFVLSTPAIEKLRFVHAAIAEAASQRFASHGLEGEGAAPALGRS